MLIPHKSINIQELNEFGKDSLSEHLEMKVTEVGPDYLCMSMPVHSKTHQPFGLLHGGAVAALAENAGSLAGNLIVGPEQACVGLSLSCNHLKSVSTGTVTACAKAVHIGRKTQVWEIETKDEEGRLINKSTLTLAVIDK